MQGLMGDTSRENVLVETLLSNYGKTQTQTEGINTMVP